MKNILLTLLFISIFSCQDKKAKNSSEILIAKEKKIEERNEVYISVSDTISSFFTNLKLDEMQDMPDMLYLGQKEDSYIIANWEKSSLYKNYNIKTISIYLLYGKDGKIIDENAPRPSQMELAELIKASI